MKTVATATASGRASAAVVEEVKVAAAVVEEMKVAAAMASG